ncbi:DUF2298 domain-containing protein [Halorientalis regularis]|uniref:Chlor_Arch_YYY domain-containing protein n=1 Tax=Halorientalis regularis TaxID=660518 RepID=A0A1G7NU39_9EURY|nr:DUF2298 domain-containing protein [Halorientalis regularis]SDF76829.1 Chlor_Arch_YYY domain-containing protein [Halorientalis regularis]
MIPIDAVVGWLVVCLVLGLAGGLIALGPLASLGHYAPAFGLPAALFVVGSVALWIGHLSITAGLVAGLAVLVVAAVVTARRTDWRDRFRAGLPAYGLFVLAFVCLLTLRAFDPAADPASGEKFLDFGLLRAHIRATALPAEDMWFAGEPFSYYYGGQFTASLLARLTGTPARLAYNLSLATFYATLVTAAYGLAGAIGQRWDAGRAAALAGVFFVGIASNLSPVVRLLSALVDGSLTSALAGLDYWPASRVVPGMITEFPLFAYLNGDLHAHMLAAPFSLLAVACLYAYFETDAGKRRYRQGVVFGIVPAIAGFVTVTNGWSLPILLGVVWLTLYFAPASPVSLGFDRLRESVPLSGDAPVVRFVRDGRALATTLATGVVALLAVGWSLPFWSVSATTGLSIAFFPTRSPLGSLLLVHGPFLAVLVPYLLVRLTPDTEVRTSAGIVVGAVAIVNYLLSGFAGVVVFAMLVLVAWFVPQRGRRSDADAPVGYEGVLALAGFGLIVLVELVYLNEPTRIGRVNTFFETYAAVWLLLAVAAAVVVGRLLSDGDGPSLPRIGGVDLGPILVAILVLSTGVYGVAAVVEWTDGDGEPHNSVDDPTLDALSFATERYPDRMAAITWLDNQSGTPALLTAPGSGIDPDYYWVNAPSSLTGVPTVAGRAREVGFRDPDAYWRRVDDVDVMFEGSRSDRHRLLDRYGVRYVYYGPEERRRYGTDRFDDDPATEPVFENDAVTIYRVNRSTLRY